MKITKITLALVASAALVAPAQAQEGIDDQVQQGAIEEGAKIIGKLGKAAGCEAVKKIPIIGGRIARELGCDKPDEEPQPGTGGPVIALDSPAIPAGELKPSLTVNFVKLTGTGDDIEASAAGSDTVYEKGSGFAMIVQNTAPGYLEIWSVDDDGAAYVEGALLPRAGALALPKSVEGLFRFTGDSTEDFVMFRFHPCEPQSQQAFELEENQEAAQLTDSAAAAVARLAQRLPACSFDTATINAAIAAKEPQDQLFRAALHQEPSFSTEASAFVIESNRVRPITSQIELKRR